MKIGVVDLDTSHPQNWIPIERELGHEIVGIWDGGAVHPREYVEKFAAERGIPRLYTSLADMAADVDCAIIHGCDWDTHIVKATPFVEVGKSVLIDKPLAGKVSDLRRLCAWAREGARISGGSSLRFCQETSDWLAKPEAERGVPDTVLCGCSTDEFNYGIHAYSLLCSILGPGAQSVRHLGKGTQRRVQINWPEGRMGLLTIGAVSGYLPFHTTIVSDKTVTHYQVDSSRIYRALLGATLPYLAGETETPPMPIEALIEPELCAIAAYQSWQDGDKEIVLAEIDPNLPSYDGAQFAVGYRKARYPG
jgi:hypothetical protein